MKIVVNRCYGGYSLSPAAVARLAELQGRQCYFFKNDYTKNKYARITIAEAESGAFNWVAFDISDPEEIAKFTPDWSKLTPEEQIACNKAYAEHDCTNRPDDRTDPLLVQVVEELGEKADGYCAELKVIEIPDDVEWEISDYDGMETIREVHRSW